MLCKFLGCCLKRGFKLQYAIGCMLLMVGHLFQNYDTIYVRFFPTYTCNHSCYTIYVRFIPKCMTIFLQTRIYMRTKNPIYMRYKQACGIWGYRKSSYKRHRIIPSAKTPSCTMELKSNFSLNQAWPQCPR